MKSLMNLVALGRPIGFPSIINVHKGERGTLGAHPPRVLFRYPEWCNRQIRTGSIADAKCGRPRNRCADCVLLVDQTGVQRERALPYNRTYGHIACATRTHRMMLLQWVCIHLLATLFVIYNAAHQRWDRARVGYEGLETIFGASEYFFERSNRFDLSERIILFLEIREFYSSKCQKILIEIRSIRILLKIFDNTG